MSHLDHDYHHPLKTATATPNHKVVAATILSFLVPLLTSGIDVAVTNLDVMTGGEGAVIGLLTAVVTFIGAYLKRPGPGDGVVPDLDA